MNMILFLQVLLIFTGSTKASIGEGFFLPGHDLYSAFEGGYPVFADLSRSCISEVPQRLRVEAEHFFQDTESFFSSISATTGIPVEHIGEYTMGATLNTKSSSLYGANKEVKGLSLDISTATAYSVLSQKCFQTEMLTPQIILDFENLPATINNPSEPTSWQMYKTFLQTYGSHVVSQVNYGSRMRQWVFSLSTSNYQQTDFELRACLDFEGPTDAGNLKVALCGGYTTEQIQSASHFNMSGSLELRGGEENTRNSLRIQRTNELITRFLNEGRNLKTIIGHSWVSIWDILKLQHSKENNLNLARALNLQQYYEGMLDFGCSLGTDGNDILRWFETTMASISVVPNTSGSFYEKTILLGMMIVVVILVSFWSIRLLATGPPKDAKAGSAVARPKSSRYFKRHL